MKIARLKSFADGAWVGGDGKAVPLFSGCQVEQMRVLAARARIALVGERERASGAQAINGPFRR